GEVGTGSPPFLPGGTPAGPGPRRREATADAVSRPRPPADDCRRWGLCAPRSGTHVEGTRARSACPFLCRNVRGGADACPAPPALVLPRTGEAPEGSAHDDRPDEQERARRHAERHRDRRE